MTITFTTEMKSRLLRFLADGMDVADVAEEFGCQPDHIKAIARNHGYPDRDRLARAADIIEENLRTGVLVPSTPTAVVNNPTPAAAGVQAQPANVGDLLRTARQHPSKRIQAAAEHIIDRVTRLRALLAADEEKHAEKRRLEAEREAARAEVQRLEQQLADAKAKLRPKTPPRSTVTPADGETSEHQCRAGCDRTFPKTQARSLHERRSHPDVDINVA